MRAFSKLLATALLVVTIAACGGPSDPPPQPLSTRFDDMYIATIGMDQKTAVVQAQNDWSVAKMENAKAEADHNEVASQLTVVRNDLRAARLAQDSAISNKKSAEASADTNRINQASLELRGAELAVKAAEARVKYYEAYQAYLKRHWRHAQENMYWREAQYELAKAQLAQKNNIAPKNVSSFDVYSQQEQERARRTQAARDKAAAEKQRAMGARQNWLSAQQQADQATGRSQNLPDPMAPRQGPSTLGAGDAPSTSP